MIDAAAAVQPDLPVHHVTDVVTVIVGVTMLLAGIIRSGRRGHG